MYLRYAFDFYVDYAPVKPLRSLGFESHQLVRVGFGGNVLLPTFNLPTGAQDARQVQWGARFSF